MRILELRFKNLNSLYGEWTIDFTRPEYVQDGIFVITGPTGAGKSTLLDGICLALYGRTPRLKSISKTTNEIMSRQTWECFSEVLFETGSGQFRAHWSQHRAHKKTDGNLVESKHEISEAATGRILASKKRETSDRIIKETGMDFERFTRSMLLAQGGFAAFLQAAPDERAPILEQITGTDIYSQISKKVHERRNEERDKLKLLKARMEGIQVLDDEEEAAVCQMLEEKQTQEKPLRKKHEDLSQSLTLLSALERLEKERVSLNQVLKEKEKDLRTLEQNSINLKDFADKAQTHLDKVKEIQKQQLILIREIRKLDNEIAQKDQACKEVASECEKIEAGIVKENQARDQAEKACGKKNESLVNISKYLSEHQADAGLAEVLATVREKLALREDMLNTCRTLKNQAAASKQSLKKEVDLYQKQQKICQTLKDRQDAIAREIAKKEKQVKALLDGRSVKGYRAEYDGLLREMAYKRKIADLEKERQQLVEGKACPLCGALDHPFAAGRVPQPDEDQKKIDRLAKILQKLDELDQQLKAAQDKAKKLDQETADARKLEQEIEYRIRHLTEEIKRFEKEHQTILDKQSKLETSVMEAFTPFGIKAAETLDFQSVCSSLTSRLTTFQAYQEDQKRIEKELNDLAAQIKQKEGILSTLSSSFEDKKKSLEIIQSGLKELKAAREDKYGLKDPDKEEARLESDVNTARNAYAAAVKKKDLAHQQLIAQKERIAELKTSMADKQAELEEKRQSSSQFKDLREKEVELKNELEKIQSDLKDIGEAVGALKHKLAENSEAKERIKSQVIQIAAQKKERSRWEVLHELIGSADGKKYRNFAQGITFELMISHANRELRKMTDRYLLIRDEVQPLELNIVDDYQAGEIRSTKNLSGGESFIVSLSLALGLSGMASGNVRVDSLFLDEGFGALDEDALETALQALTGLHRSGKLIGVISHVPALKESISTQIQIVPVSGGKSRITGPGV